MNDYEDIINLPHQKSKTRPHMSLHDRAAQFAPFAALTGFDDTIEETARLTGKRVELDEYERGRIDAKLQIIKERLGEKFQVAVTYFQQDAKKEGGSYITEFGTIKKISESDRKLIMSHGITIPVDDILEIEGDQFKNIDGIF